MSLNVLVVDDSAVMRSVIVRGLDMTGIPFGEVHEASNGREGLACLEEHWIDLALVDINMPVMNGEEMIAAMKKDPAFSDIPIIVISTEGSKTRIERLERKGARFIHKPFTPEVVKEIVTEIAGAHNERHA
jgi:two-component system chemotaxis response regulator CheY